MVPVAHVPIVYIVLCNTTTNMHERNPMYVYACACTCIYICTCILNPNTITIILKNLFDRFYFISAPSLIDYLLFQHQCTNTCVLCQLKLAPHPKISKGLQFGSTENFVVDAKLSMFNNLVSTT